MPPKIKITKEMILEASFEIVREEGYEAVNVRKLADRLMCSTQPVMYNFKTVEEIREETYKLADEYHTNYIMNIGNDDIFPILAIGINYIRFGNEEKNLFKFLFQSDHFSGLNLELLISDPRLEMIFKAVADRMKCGLEQVGEIFRKLFIMAHGYASLYANNAMEYDENACVEDLKSCEKFLD